MAITMSWLYNRNNESIYNMYFPEEKNEVYSRRKNLYKQLLHTNHKPELWKVYTHTYKVTYKSYAYTYMHAPSIKTMVILLPAVFVTWKLIKELI